MSVEQTHEKRETVSVGSGALVGRSVSVRNVIDHHGINGMDWLDEEYRIAGAPKYVEAVIVSVHPCWRGPGFGYVRVEYPATYFGGRLPRYANVAMRRLRAPNTSVRHATDGSNTHGGIGPRCL